MSKTLAHYFSDLNGTVEMRGLLAHVRGLSMEEVLCLANVLGYMCYRGGSRFPDDVTLTTILKKTSEKGVAGGFPKEMVQRSVEWLCKHGVILLASDHTYHLQPKGQWCSGVSVEKP